MEPSPTVIFWHTITFLNQFQDLTHIKMEVFQFWFNFAIDGNVRSIDPGLQSSRSDMYLKLVANFMFWHYWHPFMTFTSIFLCQMSWFSFGLIEHNDNLVQVWFTAFHGKYLHKSNSIGHILTPCHDYMGFILICTLEVLWFNFGLIFP